MKRFIEETSPEQQQSSKGAKIFGDKKSKRNMKSSESSPEDKELVPPIDIEIIPSASAPHEFSMPTVESGIVPMKEDVLEDPVPSIGRNKLKEKEKPSESSVVEITENIPPAAVSTQETPKHSKQEDGTKAPQSVENEEMEIKLPKKDVLEAKVVPVEQGASKKPSKSKKTSNSPHEKGETHHVLKSSDEHKDDKKQTKPRKTSESTKDSEKRSPGKHKPVEELIPSSFSAVLESATVESQKDKSYIANQDESIGSEKQTTQKSEDTAKPTEFRYELTEQNESSKKCSESQKQPESFSEKMETEAIMKPLEGVKDDKKINQSKKQPKPTRKSENEPTIEHKPSEELKSVSPESAILPSKVQKESSKTNSIGKQDKPKDSKKKALRNNNEELKATTSKMDNSPTDSTPTKQSETGKTGSKRDRRGEKKQAKSLRKSLEESKTPQTLEFKEGGIEITNQPPKESTLAKREDGAETKQRINKKRKATDDDDDSSGKKYKKAAKNLKKKTDDNEKKRKKRKRPQPEKERDEGTDRKSAKRPRIGNLECGRFPKAFAVQVPHRVAQHRRDGAPVSTHALGKATKGFTTKMSVERRNRNKPSKAIQRWKLRKSLQRVGTVVILLAGRHRVNGIPIRRVHPDYVIATKTVIKMDKIRLPGRMQTPDRKTYVLKDERKEDQKLIDKRVIAAIKQTKTAKMLFAYLRSQFSLSRTDRPHKMVF
nr:hypothetical transcript [Hymenolepis microstoma]